jgi:porin
VLLLLGGSDLPRATAQSVQPLPYREGQPLEEELRKPKNDAAKADRDKKEDEEKKEKEKEPELPPGLLGYFLHGNDRLKAEYIYTGEMFTNMRGGRNTNDAAAYRGLFDLALTADLEKMGLSPGGKFFMLSENAHGMGLTEGDVGDFQWLSNIDGRQFTQVTEYWWERKLGDDFFLLRLGKQDCNTEFGVLDLAGDFIQSSLTLHPTIPMPTWPESSMGAVALFQVTDWLAFKSGIWDGLPDGGNWGFSGSGVTFSIFELEAEYSLCDKQLPGDCHVGMWYHSDQFDDITPLAKVDGLLAFRTRQALRSRQGLPLGGPGDTYAGNHGIYLGVEQLLFAEPEASKDEGDEAKEDEADKKEDDEPPQEEEEETEDGKTPQGLGTFLQYSWAPEDRNVAHQYFGSGVVYKGLLRGRDDDVAGLGVAHLIFSDRLPDRTSETAVELFYKIQLSPWTVLQPDLQYIARPSGKERDAFAFGLRFELTL